MSQLMLHRGARTVERNDVELVEAPPPTDTWFPLRHGQVLSTAEGALGTAGFQISRSQYALSQDNARFFGTLDLSTSIVEGVSLTVGVRNSIDKTFPLGLVAGSRVFVCDNLAFSAEIYVSKRHTRFGESRFNEGISHAITALNQYQQVEARRIGHYRAAEIDEKTASSCILHAYEEGILSPRTLPNALDEWRKPAREDFEPRTAWSLFNALTSALKERQGNPAQFASLTMRLYGLVDREVQYQAAV